MGWFGGGPGVAQRWSEVVDSISMLALVVIRQFKKNKFKLKKKFTKFKNGNYFSKLNELLSNQNYFQSHQTQKKKKMQKIFF